MSAGKRRSRRDVGRRTLGQNFLVDRGVVDRLIETVQVNPGELVVDLGAGKGELTLALARAGAKVLAVEIDPVWVNHLRDAVGLARLDKRVKVVEGDLRRVPLPTPPYRVVANPPFAVTTTLIARLLDRPEQGPWRADLLIQVEVARKRAAQPPNTLRSAAWAPWWTFEHGPTIPARAFRPVPSVDIALLTIQRREPPLLPYWLAPHMRELLRPAWVAHSADRKAY